MDAAAGTGRMIDSIQGILHTGLTETVLLALLILLLSLNELLIGVEGKFLKRIRRLLQVAAVPLVLVFAALAVARIAKLV